MGVGYNLVLRSLLTQLIETHHQGTLFTIIAVVEELGALVAGPLLAICFRISLSLEGIWTGLPYLPAACLSLIAVIILYCIRV
jgi:sugar phosphate permease